MYEPDRIVTSAALIRDMMPARTASQASKILDHVDAHIRIWIERSPFVAIATVDGGGAMDVSPKGDPAGFVRVLDPKTLAIPDRPGNHRYDSFANIIETGRIGLMFLVPNRREVARVNGSAWVVQDDDLRATMAIKGRVPDFALVVRVEEAFYHCGKAIIRSGLWDPDKAAPIDGLPSYAEAVHAQANLPDTTLDELEARFRYNEEKRLYDE